MRISITIIALLFVFSTGFAQANTDLNKAIRSLNTALLQKDSVTLKKLLHEKVTYGHSNGWIENKREVIEDLYNGKLVYNKIEQSELEMTIEGNTATVRAVSDVDVLLNGKQIQLKLHVLQAWTKHRKDWVLLGRQSIKVN